MEQERASKNTAQPVRAYVSVVIYDKSDFTKYHQSQLTFGKAIFPYYAHIYPNTQKHHAFNIASLQNAYSWLDRSIKHV